MGCPKGNLGVPCTVQNLQFCMHHYPFQHLYPSESTAVSASALESGTILRAFEFQLSAAPPYCVAWPPMGFGDLPNELSAYTHISSSGP